MDVIKCVIVGDGAVGKTSTLISYTTNAFDGSYIPTIFDNYSMNVMIGQKVYNLSIWDTAGQEDYDNIRPLSYAKTDVFLICYAVNSIASLNNVVNKWLPEINKHAPSIPRILVGLKSDLRGVNSPLSGVDAKIVPMEGVLNVKKLGEFNEFMECSAMTQDGLKAVFDTAIRLGMDKIATQDDGTSSAGCGKCSIM